MLSENDIFNLKRRCSNDCKPCMRQCENECVHSRCNLKCSEPCEPCNEKCAKTCEHSQCTMKCGEKCNREPCREPCGQTIRRCGHPCAGLCGEPCPEICRVCQKKNFLKLSYGENKFDPSVRFVQLEDCRHCIESEFMDRLIQTHSGLNSPIMSANVVSNSASKPIRLPQCPVCQTPIRRNQRYSNYLRELIQKMKLKQFGDPQENKRLFNELKFTIEMETRCIVGLKKIFFCIFSYDSYDCN